MSWYIFDTMRGIVTGGNDSILAPNDNLVEETASQYLDVTPTGFISHFNALAGSRDYIYMAIRAPMMVEPKAATNVFAIDTRGSTGDGKKPAFRSGFPVDVAVERSTGGSGGHTSIHSRPTGPNYLRLNTGAAEAYDQVVFDYNNGHYGLTDTNASFHAWMWKRAKGYMDVVTWKGNATARTIPHSLGVVPEMIWVKNRDVTEEWFVYTASEGLDKWLYLSNVNDSQSGISTLAWNNTAPSATVLSLGTHNFTNDNNRDLIAYLFATLAGISKVGSYTGNGSYQTINCGFSAGSRFILIKRTDTNGDWYFWDSLRGIVAGNDPHFSVNTKATHVTTDDSVDPHNSGFIVNQVSATNINVSSGTYIFYAIA